MGAVRSLDMQLELTVPDEDEEPADAEQTARKKRSDRHNGGTTNPQATRGKRGAL